MKIRKLRHEDVIPASDLIYKIFKKYNGNDYFDEGSVKRALDYFDTRRNSKSDLILMFKQTPISFVAVENYKIIGVIRGTESKVTSLMVDGKYHGQGLGKKLLKKFELEAVKRGSNFIKFRSSLFAVNFYENSGYKKTTGIRQFMGLKIYNLKKILS